jgi:hypothetical protein
MPPKKASGLGVALQPLDVNQETLCEARNQKRKATSPTPQEEEPDQEIKDLEVINEQVQRKKEKMLCLVDIQPLRKCVISPKMTRTDDLNAESFARKFCF